MKRNFYKSFYLQLFADDTATAANSATSANSESQKAQAVAEPEKATDTKEPAPAATLKDKGELKYSDKDLDEILSKKFAKWQEKQQKAVDEAQKLATMNATQKAEYERDQLQKELDELKKQASLAEMMKTSRKMLAEEGITVTDELLSIMVNTNAEETKASVDSFTKLFKEAVESAVKDRLRGETPKAGTGAAAPVSEIEKRIKKYM
jgi:uncharacterized protein (DUF885 family)